jgi:putative endonuclease
MAGDKRFVYVLRNASEPHHFYVGLTSDVNARLADHNAGRCPHTMSRRPWQIHVVIEFSEEPRAVRFERYLKSGSGRSFAKRHSNREPRRTFGQLPVSPRQGKSGGSADVAP